MGWKEIAAARSEAARRRRALVVQRDAMVKETTRKWREGFARLKRENDDDQRLMQEWYETEQIEITAWLNDMIEGAQR